MEKDEIWIKTLAQIEVKLDSVAQFRTWFKDTKLTAIDGKYAVIQVKNPYTSDWLKNRHEKLINDTISYVAGRPLKVKFEINGKLADNENENEVEETEDNTDKGPLLNMELGIDASVLTTIRNAGLNDKYTVNNYVVGTSNKLAHSAATAVINAPGTVYNPLFIYGPTGVGKTHLAQAVGRALIEKNPNRKVVYTPSEGFLNDMVKAISNGKSLEFRQRYRKIDCLIIDDIQYISTWEKTQDEFFNTFNELYNANKQIILVSDRKPEEIKSIDSRIRTRFMGGIAVDIAKPDYAMRIALLQKKSLEQGIDLPAYICEYLAKTITDNMRELEGSIQKISLFNNMKGDGSPLSINEIASIIGHDTKSKRGKITVAQILKSVSSEFNVKVTDIKGPKRTAELALARQVAMYILRDEFEYKLEKIADILNKKDHTTIIHGIDKIKSLIAVSDGFREQIIRVKDLIRNASE